MNESNIRPISRRWVVGSLATVAAGTMAFGANARLVAGAPRGTDRARRALAQAGTPTVPPAPTGPHALPPLAYDYAALEPHIDTTTMQIHHDKHHQTYVDNLNKAVADLPDLATRSPLDLIQGLADAPEEKRATIRNNAGGHVNHTMFWESMKPGGGGLPTGAVADAITAGFGDFATFQEAVNAAGLGRFGSGWAWALVGADGEIAVTSTPNQDNPLMGPDLVETAGSPFLGVDVWEHAYYLKYQNKRKDYLTAWWNTIDWDRVNGWFAAASGG